jgi:hypothetical protein
MEILRNILYSGTVVAQAILSAEESNCKGGPAVRSKETTSLPLGFLNPSLEMVVKIRLSRFGNRHSPFYNIVVAQARYVHDRFRLAG